MAMRAKIDPRTNPLAAKSLRGPPHVKSFHNPLQGQQITTFTDQDGRTIISAYYGKRPQAGASILPPKWSFQVFVTYGATADSAPGLPQQLLTVTRAPVSDSYPLRLDVHFAPGADAEACMEQYRADRDARRAAGAPLQVLDPYRESSSKLSIFVQIEHEDWESKGATIVSFDMISDLDDEGQPLRTSSQCDVQWGSLKSASGNKVFVGNLLHNLAAGTGQDELNEEYQERIEQGHSDWP